ncbi:CD109 antigen-like isoform X1 [Glossina fuscipes]|uniref:TEP1-F n=1 Tax=Glossina fuscipes TaxID=7396 RepID=A0A8U0WEE9_9MUSC|nr:CD109 antigen-like isoform X1 [Glossina fuscipes]
MWQNRMYILLHMLWVVNANGIYSIVASGSIYSNRKYSISVTLHDARQSATFNIGISGPSYNHSKCIELSPNENKRIDFNVPELKKGIYQLVSKGIRGLFFENTTYLSVEYIIPNLYIQTDKAMYKPGDLVQYRILVLDENLRPLKSDQPLAVAIKDAANNLIKVIKNAQLIKGVFSDKLQLTEQPVLGLWTIEVSLSDHIEKTKEFEVAKYVLPKFSVDIDAVTDMAITESSLKITVRAKYTYGKSVKGKATVHLSPVDLEKTIDVNGKGHVEFDLKKDLNLIVPNRFVGELNVFAVVEEELTGNRQNTTVKINLHRSPYRIEVSDMMREFEINQTIEVKVVIKYLNGKPVQDTKAPVLLKFYNTRRAGEDPKIWKANLDEHGVAIFKTSFQNDGFYWPELIFAEEIKHMPSISVRAASVKNTKLVSQLTLELETIKPRLDEYVSIAVKAPNVMKHLIYAVVGRGAILQIANISLPRPQQFYKITFRATFEMMPRANVFVYYVDEFDLKFQEITLEFLSEFENKVKITGPLQAKPGQDVSLEIKADPNSYIGLLGVDQSMLLLKSGNDLEFDAVLKNLHSLKPVDKHYQNSIYTYPGERSGLVVMTNAHFPYESRLRKGDSHYELEEELSESEDDDAEGVDEVDSSCVKCEFVPQAASNVNIRINFREIWLWSALNFSNDNMTSATVTKSIPDTITSWVITAFAVNEKTGLGMTEKPFKINVFQPFFIDVNLPYSVKRGEVIAIPVIIFNYMDKTLDAEITMDNTDKEYDFTEVSNEIEESILSTQKRMKRVSVPPNSGESVSFMIRPAVVADIELKISAASQLAGDAIHKKLKVEAEGVTQYENQALFLNLEEPHKASLEVDIPPEAVKDSEYVEFSVVGDLLGPTMNRLNELVRKPYGCGEQNMVNFVPNILVLHYLEALQIDMPNVASKAKNFLEIGYQRELTYKHRSGAYSAFGEDRSTPNTWLTAYVARSFIQATKYTTIDEKVIQQAFDFLIANQEKSGQFKQTGHLFSPTHQNDVGFNAYVLLAFLENEKYAELYQKQIEKCLEYVVSQLENEKNSYALSIAAVALHKANHTAADRVLEKLQAEAKEENGFKWWTSANHNDIEITAYALQTLVDTEPINQILPIIKWLIGQRNSNGGFDSTQNTVVGLEALIKFSKKFSITGNSKMSITFKAFDEGKKELTQHRFEVNKDNSLVLQTHVLPKSTRSLSLEAEGAGSSLIQLSYQYNLATKDDRPGFKLDIKPKILPSQQLQINICANYQPAVDDEINESNMAVMEVALPSGYVADSEKLNDILAADRVQRIDTESSDTKVIVYLDGLVEDEQVCVTIVADKAFAVAKQKPVPVTLYDYYNSAYRGTEYYRIESSLCDICEGDDCGTACK